MIVKYIKKFKVQLSRFLIIGVTSTIIDLFSLFILKEKLNFNPVFAVSINQFFVIMYNFLLNKYWSFNSKKMPLQQFIKYLILVLFNYLISIFLMYIFYQKLHINYIVIRLFSICFMFIVNFILYKNWIYKDKKI